MSAGPSDAMSALATPPELSDDLRRERQDVCLAGLYNACGNCETFCPGTGASLAVKPRLFPDRERFAADGGPAFLIGPPPSDADRASW